MKKDALAIIKKKWTDAKDWKVEKIHPVWRSIMREYRMDNFYEMAKIAERLSSMTGDLSAMNIDHITDARVASLNVYVRKLATLLNLQNPDFLVDNDKPGQEAIAWLLEQYTPYLQRIINMPDKAREAVLHGALFGTACAKKMYTSEFVYGEDAYAGKLNKKDAHIREDAELPQGASTEYSDVTVKPGHANFQMVYPTDIFFWPMNVPLNRVRLIFHRSERLVTDIYADERYAREARRAVKGKPYDETDESTWLTKYEDEYVRDVKLGDVIECFDRSTRQFMVFNEEVDTELRDWRDFPFSRVDDPFTFWRPIRDPESAWGIPYAFLMLPQCKTKNYLRAIYVDQAGRDGKRTTFIDTDVIPQDKIDEANNSEHGTMIGAPGISEKPINTAIQMVEWGGASPEVMKLHSMIDADLDFMSGLDDPTRNAYRSGDQTATEIHTRQQQQGVTIEDMRDTFEEFLEHVMQDIFKITAQYWDDGDMIKIVGDDPRIYAWVPLNRQQLLENFTLKIRAGSTEKMDKMTYRRQLIDLAPTIERMAAAIDQEAMNAQQAQFQSPVNRVELLKEILEPFGRRLSDKVLRRNDPMSMMQALQQQGIQPAMMSPMMQQGMNPAAGGPMPPNVAPFNAGQIPGQETIQFGQPTQDTAAGQSGRQLSEVNG